jgi:hypothetical protein
LLREGGRDYNAAQFPAYLKEFKMRVRYAIAIAVAAALLVPATITLYAQTAPAPVLKKSAPPARGLVELGYVQSAKLEGNTIVTTFQLRNMTLGSIVGLTITEFWYDKAGNPIQGTGDRQRLRTPLQPGEVATVTLKSPKVAGMTSPQYKFSHQYGDFKLTKLKSIKQS